MNKYIKLEDAIEAYRKSLEQNKSFVSMLQKLPSVEIVRCKDCIDNDRNCDGGTENWCLKFGYECEDDDWCSHGVRCENEKDKKQ